jgi:hypothetical protein
MKRARLEMCFFPAICIFENEAPNGTAFLIIIEGTTEEVLQFIMPLKSVCNQNLGFIEQKHIFEHFRDI